MLFVCWYEVWLFYHQIIRKNYTWRFFLMPWKFKYIWIFQFFDPDFLQEIGLKKISSSLQTLSFVHLIWKIHLHCFGKTNTSKTNNWKWIIEMKLSKLKWINQKINYNLKMKWFCEIKFVFFSYLTNRIYFSKKNQKNLELMKWLLK